MPFGADVLINGIWCHPDSDYARRYGYDQKTKTVNIQKGVEYLEKSKPVSKVPLAQKIRREVDAEIKKVKSYSDDNWAPSYRKGYEASVKHWAKQPKYDPKRAQAYTDRYYEKSASGSYVPKTTPAAKRHFEKVRARSDAYHAAFKSESTKRSVSKKRKTPRTKKKTPRTKKKTPRASLWTPGRKLAQKKCARNSFRTVKPNAKTLITLCCPPGKWMPRKKKCRVPLRPHLKRVPRKRRA